MKSQTAKNAVFDEVHDRTFVVMATRLVIATDNGI
jgi:hypothetical protein